MSKEIFKSQRYLKSYKTIKLYSNKLVNLEEMDQFLETYRLLRLNQEGKYNLKRLFIRNKAEFEKFLANNSSRPDGFTDSTKLIKKS